MYDPYAPENIFWEDLDDIYEDYSHSDDYLDYPYDESDDDEPDYFWVKVLIVTIIIVWGALIAGSWAGNYFLKSEFFIS